MIKAIEESALDLRAYIRPGDTIFISEAAGEPSALVRALIRQRAELGGVRVFLGYGAAENFAPEHADHIAFLSYGALGTNGRLAAAGVLDIVPTSLGHLPRAIASGALACDVAFVSVAPGADAGSFSYGASCLLMPAAVRAARVVLAELNACMPRTPGPALTATDIAALIETDTALPNYSAAPDATASAVAARVADFIRDRCVIQLGIGAIPDALPRHLGDRSGLGIHSGVIGDGVIDLIERGVVTNEHKPLHRGVTVAGMLLGTEHTYRFAERNRSIRVEAAEVTHGQAGQLPDLISVNGAVEVDLLGQVNAELVGERYLGAIGGQPDFVRAAQASAGGRSIIALPSATAGARVSRIRPPPLARVTTPRHDVDVIVTEFGAAELAGKSVRERARLLINIAHPDHRAALEEAAYGLKG